MGLCRDVQISGLCVLQSKIPLGNTKVNPPSSDPEESYLQVITSDTHQDTYGL